jgi:hypothetical protein
LIGVAEVAHYAVPMSLILRTGTIPMALGRTFFPRLSSLPRDAAHELGRRALEVLGYGYAVVCAPGIILAQLFFRYWIGPEFAIVSAPVAQILFLGVWFTGLSFVAYTLIQSQGRPDLTGKLHFAELLPFLGVLWVLTASFGINGAATAWTLRCIVDAFAMFWANIQKRCRIDDSAPGRSALRQRDRGPVRGVQPRLGDSCGYGGRPDLDRACLRLFRRLSANSHEPAGPSLGYRRGTNSAREAAGANHLVS